MGTSHHAQNCRRWAVFATTFFLLGLAPAGAHTLRAIEDTFISLAAAGANFGAESKLIVQSAEIGKAGGETRAFVRFDLSALPDGVQDTDVESATLRLWVNRVEEPGSIDLHFVLDEWEENALTAEPILTTVPVGAFSIGAEDGSGFVEVDVTELVRHWLDDPELNFGLALAPRRSDAIGVSMDSREVPETDRRMTIEVKLWDPERSKERAEESQDAYFGLDYLDLRNKFAVVERDCSKGTGDEVGAPSDSESSSDLGFLSDFEALRGDSASDDAASPGESETPSGCDASSDREFLGETGIQPGSGSMGDGETPSDWEASGDTFSLGEPVSPSTTGNSSDVGTPSGSTLDAPGSSEKGSSGKRDAGASGHSMNWLKGLQSAVDDGRIGEEILGTYKHRPR